MGDFHEGHVSHPKIVLNLQKRSTKLRNSIPSKIVPPGPQWLEKKSREATAAGGGPFGAAGAVGGGAAGGAPLGKDACIGIILG